jgi:hypothetical protein
MEVHHHSHKPKKISEYFTEFIMLFAAVTLGFIAENLREHQIENNRAKEYLELFKTEVIKNDNAIDSVFKYGVPVLNRNEKLYFSLYGDKDFSSDEIAEEIDLMLYRFSNDKRIFELMKNSGSLRYIKDKKLIEEINEYESAADFAEFRTFDQESAQIKLFWDFLVREIPPALILKWLSKSKVKSELKSELKGFINVNGQYPALYAQNKLAIDQEMKVTQLTKKQKDVLLNYLINKCTIQKLSIINLRLLKKKSEPLLKHIETYLEIN